MSVRVLAFLVAAAAVAPPKTPVPVEPPTEFVYPREGTARCVVVYPREGSLGWLIDRKENEAHLFYLEAPLPGWCKK